MKMKKLLALLLTLVMVVGMLPVAALADGELPTVHFTTDDSDKYKDFELYLGQQNYNTTIKGPASWQFTKDSRNLIRIENYDASSSPKFGGLHGFTVSAGGATSDVITVDTATLPTDATTITVGTVSTASNNKIQYYQMSNNNRLRLQYTCFAGDPDITVHWIFKASASGFTCDVDNSDSTYGMATATTTSTENVYTLTATPNPGYAFDHWEYRIGNDMQPVYTEWATYPDLPTASGTVTVTANTKFRAHFNKAQLFLRDDCLLYWASAINQNKILTPGSLFEDSIGSVNYSDQLFWYNTDVSPTPAVPGDACGFEFQWDVTGPIAVLDSEGNQRKARIKVFGGTDTSTEPVFDSGTISIVSYGNTVLAPHGSTIRLNIILPKAEYLTVVFEVEGFETQTKTYATGLNFALQDALDTLGAELNTLENLRYRYFIDKILLEASRSAFSGMTNADINNIVAAARAEIEGYINGTNTDYIEVCFNDTMVFVETGIPQSAAFEAALEQVYPREKGFWFFDCAVTQFGYWVNGYGGRAFTAKELGPDGVAHTADDGVLETAIVTPSKTFAAGEPLPTSGLVMGSQAGNLQYYVNGKYSDFGVTGWNVSDNEIYTWGPGDGEALYNPLYSLDHIDNTGTGYMYGDDSDETALLWAVAYLHRIGVTKAEVLTAIGMTDTSGLTAKELYEKLLAAYPQYAVRLSRDTATDMGKIPSVVAAYEAINAIEGKTGDERIAAVVAARKALDSINLNGQTGLKKGFLQGYFGSTEPYKIAYQKLGAAEDELGIEPPEQASPATALDGVLTWLESNVKAPVVGSMNGEWAVLVLARSGVFPADTKAAYLGNLNTALTAGNVITSMTDYERVTLALSALGIDASAYGGKDLTTPYATYSATGNKTLNADIYALLALNAKPYTGEQDKYVTAICGAALAGGGWNLYSDGTFADVDTTAMAIEALAPYYESNATVKEKIDAALTWLKTKQDGETGGFKSLYGTEVSTSSTAQVVTALCALGIDPDGADWTENGKTALSALTLWYNEDGWFGETDAAAVNQMSTEQAAYALVAWDRWKKGQNALYDMRDAFGQEASGDSDLAALKAKVEGLSWRLLQADAGSEAEVKTAVERKLSAGILGDAKATVTITQFAAAVAGSEDATSGTNGSYTARIVLTKGEETETVTVYGTITATRYKKPSDKDKDKITVTFRLVGAKQATQDVDLGKNTYLPEYVTWIPTTTYTIDANSTMYDLYTLATGVAGVESVGAENNYVKTVTAPASLGGYDLSEFTNGTYSGWMYTVNGKHPNVGLKAYVFADDPNVTSTGSATVVWHYINDYRYESSDWYGGSLGDAKVWDGWLKATDSIGGAGGGAAAGEVKKDKEKTEAEGVTLTSEEVKAAAEKGEGVKVETENGVVKLDAETVKELAKGGEDVVVDVEDNGDGTKTVSVTAGDKAVDADVKIELPAKDGQMLVVVGADGTETPVILSASENGTVYAEVPAGATVKVVDAEGMSFGDVAADDWFAGAVEFVSSHGIFQGTGEGFEPGTTMNRAMLAMVLYRIDGATGGGTSTFADVKPEDWFADAVAWAADAGIVNGRGEGFAPDVPVTREEIATMLYRFVKYLGVDVSGASADLSKFPDGGETSSWAGDAMAWAVSVGLFQGDDNGALNPGGEATRAEVATLVERLVKLLVK